MTEHIDIERLIAAAEGKNEFSDREKEHFESCIKCRKLFESAKHIKTDLKNISEKELFFCRRADAEAAADKVFEMMSAKKHTRKIIGYISAAAAAAVVVFAFSFRINEADNGSSQEKYSVETAQNELVEESVDSIEKENIKDEKFIAENIDIKAGSEFLGENFRITAKSKSSLIREDENYFTLKSGKAEFSVKSGTDFRVNLNGKALIRVLGTVFTLTASDDLYSVEVKEGLVEVVNRKNGKTTALAAGKKEIINRQNKVRPLKRNIVQPEVASAEHTDIVEEIPEVKQETQQEGKPSKKQTRNFLNTNDREMQLALIADLEASVDVSDDPLSDLNQLFTLYKKTGNWGAIIRSWNKHFGKINSTANPYMQEMAFHACEASIKLYLYGNGICKDFKKLYPNAKEPEGLKDHLNMAH